MQVYVIRSRLPVYRAWYGDGLGSTIAGLFTRMAPKIAPLAKQLGMKAMDVIRDKGPAAVGNLASKAFTAAKDKIMSLVRRRKQPGMTKSLVLPSTAAMPAATRKEINNAVQEKLASLATSSLMTPSSDAQSNEISNMIAGSGLRIRRRR